MARHANTDSDVTSLAASSPPRSPRGRPAYYVLSPAASHPDVHLGASGRGAAAAEKMSLAGSTPAESPLHYHFRHHHHSSGAGGGVHHSRESSTGRLLFSDNLRSGGDVAAVVSAPWRRLAHSSGAGSDDDEEGSSLHGGGLMPPQWRCYVFGVLAFFVVFAFFMLVLWGASRSYKPHVVVKMKEFYQPRKSGRVVTVSVVGKQVPLYGAGVSLHSKPNNGRLGPAVVPVRLAFVLRARAHILGLLVKSKFYRRVRCGLDIREAHLGKPLRGVAADCQYHDGPR
nr:unnamed protein product [Digitaria exilis]